MNRYDLIVIANSKLHAEVLQEEYDEAGIAMKVKCISKRMIEKELEGIETKFLVLAHNVELNTEQFDFAHIYSRKMEKLKYGITAK